MSAADTTRIECPECHKGLRIAPRPPGTRVKCPGCGARIAVAPAEAQSGPSVRSAEAGQVTERSPRQPAAAERSTVANDRAWSYGTEVLSAFHLLWILGMAALAFAVGTSSAATTAQPLGGVFLPMAGLTAVIASLYAIACSPVNYSLGSLVAAAAGFVVALVPAGFGLLSVQLVGPELGIVLYGGVLGSVIWHLLFWIRNWPWGVDLWLGAGALGERAGVFVTREMLDGKTLCTKSVRYMLPSGDKLSGLLVVTDTELFFQTPLAPGHVALGMEPVLAINWRLDLGSVLLAKDRLGVTIRKDRLASLVAEKGWFSHRLMLTTKDGRVHQLRCGLFPSPKLFHSIRQGLPSTVGAGSTWEESAPVACRGEAQGIEPPYFLLRCENRAQAEALVGCRTPGVAQRLRGEPRVIPYDDGSAAAYLPLRDAADAKPYLEELFRSDSVGKTTLRGGLCAGLSEDDNGAVLATVGLSQACIHGATLILG